MAERSDRAAREPSFPLLRQTQLSSYLTQEQLSELEGSLRLSTRRLGAAVFRQRDRAEALFLVLEGAVELRVRPPGRRMYRTVEVAGLGCTFGDESILEGQRYLFGARALEPVRLLVIPLTRFEALAKSRPEVALGLVRCAGTCLIQTLRRAAILAQAPPELAIQMLLEEIASAHRRGSGVIRVKITQAQLAGILHLSRETVSRTLSVLAAKGAIELSRGVISIP